MGEGLYGGAAGGGKSDALLMAAAEYVDTPGYAALLIRESFSDLNQPDALIPRSKEWWLGKADWDTGAHRWTFPSGATVTFGYLERDDSVYQYQSAAYQFIGIDELTQHTEWRWTYLASRLRRPAAGPLSAVPLRMRAATNPGGRGHEWVKKRFLPDAYFKADTETQFARAWYKADTFFVPAKLEDNPSLDMAAYEKRLAKLDPLTRAQLRRGDWLAHASGRFRPEWFRRYRDIGDAWRLLDTGEVLKKEWVPFHVCLDPANRKTKASKYTAICVTADLGAQRILVADVVREQLGITEIVPRLAGVCRRHRPQWVGIEANGFQIALVEEARKTHGIPTVLELMPEGKSKLTRATPAILRAEQGLVYVPDEAPWVDDFLAELCQFVGDEREDAYTDQVDTLAYAVLQYDRRGNGDDLPAVASRRRQ